MKTKVSSKGQIVLPAQLRLQDRIEAGQEFDVERVDIDWLLACPEKDFFVPLEFESTETL